MKTKTTKPTNCAMTLIEVLLIILVMALLAAIFLPVLASIKKKSARIGCANCLKQMGLAYRVWEGDHADKYPAFVSATNGGILEMTSQGSQTVVLNFLTMSNELSTPTMLHCPNDGRTTETHNFSALSVSNISYFINLDAADNYPQMVLSGDDNLTVHGTPVQPGRLILSTNSNLGWNGERHHGSSNIGLADGSAQQMTSAGLETAFQQSTGTNNSESNNRIIIP